jgi:hypothetical protein
MYSRLSTKLIHLGFRISKANTSLFIYSKYGVVIYLLVYVDNIVVTSYSPSTIMTLLDDLRSNFNLKDLGELHYFWGIQDTKVDSVLSLSQEKYASGILSKAGMQWCKLVKTMFVTSLKLTLSGGTPLSNDEATKYRSLVGGLQYLTLTRLDVSFAVNKVCQFHHAPTDLHLAAVKRILRYIQGTLSLGLKFHRSSSLKPSAFLDVDWAGCLDDWWST